MNLSEYIVNALLDDLNDFDPATRTDLYPPTGGTVPDGRKIVRVCGDCETEFGASKKYPPNLAPSHGICRRHAIKKYIEWIGLTPEQAAAKVTPNTPPDWEQVLGPAPKTSTIGALPKATFWATSGSGAY